MPSPDIRKRGMANLKKKNSSYVRNLGRIGRKSLISICSMVSYCFVLGVQQGCYAKTKILQMGWSVPCVRCILGFLFHL